MTSNSSTSMITVRSGDLDGPVSAVLNEGGSFLLENYTTVILDFYTVDSTAGGVGFLIDYASGNDEQNF